MKKIIGIALLACLLTAGVFAEETKDTKEVPYQMLRIGLEVDYAKVAMDQVNTELNKSNSVTAFSSGFSGMLNVDVVLIPFLMVGARAGVVYCQPGSAKDDYIIYKQTKTIEALLIPLEAGITANLEIPSTSITLMAGVYGGYGVAISSVKNDLTLLGQTATFTQPYDGGNFIAEAIASVNIKILTALSINVNGGYRMAKIAQMKQSADVNYTEIPGLTIPVGAKGDVLQDSDSKDLAYDYSGLSIGVGVSLGF